MHKKQIAVIVIVFAIMGYLYTRPVKGLIKPKSAAAGHVDAAPGAKPRAVTNISIDSI